MTESPYKTMFEQPVEGIFQQELVTYRVQDGMLTKTTVTRKFYSNDYIDSESTEPLCPIN